ncbi:MAG: Prolyl oligopeptidase [Gemmatimonadetes bacterium]|nr:Prolyl oligopeptidase [Gemmatimonadota bacterium]
MHGVEIVDPYRWLEDGDPEEVRRWTEAQNAHTEAWLSAVPARAGIRCRLQQLLSIGVLGTPTPARGRYLYQRREGTTNQPILYVRDGLEGRDRVAIDPNALSAEGTTALDWYHVSPDGRRLAYGLSADGSEQSVLRLLDLDDLSPLADRIPRTRSCDLAWLPDNSGFYYTRYPAPGSVPAGEEPYHRAVWFHRVGHDPDADRLVFQPAEKEHWPGVSLSDDGRWLLIGVARTFDETDLYVQDLTSGAAPVPVAVGIPATFDGQVARGVLYLRTNLDAPTFRLYAVDPAAPSRDGWRELVPARPDAVLSSVGVTAKHLVLDYLDRATARLQLAALDGSGIQDVHLPTLGSLFGLGLEPDGNEVLFGFSSFTVPPSVYRLDPTTGTTTLWRRVEADIEPERFRVNQVEYSSADGTRITMFLVHRRDVERNGRQPTFLTGYGGFNISMTPAFSRSMLLWLESGGVVAIPNLRGGGEYGESWHQQGMLGRKQNTFDDFIAAAEWLIASGWTSPRELAIQGGSNGGLLMGAVLTQRPELFRAVVVQVPLLDMLRYHRFLIARLWIPEYGSADDPEQFGWLSAYSPYHQVRDGVAYPAVLIATAESDTRVDPLHARKMTARLQRATSSGLPVLLRLESRAGHGAGKPLAKVLDELTDTWTFIWHELGLAAPEDR